MINYSISNPEQYEAVKADIQGSINAKLDALFKKAHLMSVRTDGCKTYLNFEWVENGVLQRDTVWVDARLFSEPETSK